MTARVLIALLLLPAQTSAPVTARLVVQYRVSSEDDTSNAGKLTLPLRSGEVKRARVWEAECHVSASDASTAPDVAPEQLWGFGAELVHGRDNRPSVRLTASYVAPNGIVHDSTHTLTLDDPHPLAISELSARTDCRYDRVHLTLAAETVRASDRRSPDSRRDR